MRKSFVASLTCLGAVAAGMTASAEDALRAVVTLEDGSRLVGELTLDRWPVESAVAGKLNIPTDKISCVNFSADQPSAMLTLVNGDKIQGAIDLASVGLKAVFGTVTIPLKHVRQIDMGSAVIQRQDGLVLWYSFNTDDGERVVDQSRLGNDGVVHGARFTPQGASGGACHFDGADAYIDCGNAESLRIKGPFTISAWVKLDTLEMHEHAIVSKGATPSRWASFALTPLTNDGHIGLYSGNGLTGDSLSSKRALEKNTWYHLVGLFRGGDDNRAEIWIDGVLDTSGSLEPPKDTSEPVYVGRWRSGYGCFRGAVDEVRIYNRALTADEITAHYRAVR